MQNDAPCQTVNQYNSPSWCDKIKVEVAGGEKSLCSFETVG
jgi:hypothetical protein